MRTITIHFMCFATALSACSALRAAPAGEKEKDKNVVRVKTLRISGKVHSVGNRVINVVTDGNQKWIVALDSPFNQDKPKVEIKSIGTAKDLVPGRFVRFEAVFDRRGKAQAPLQEVLMFFATGAESPYQAGAVPSGNVGEKPDPKAKTRAMLITGQIVSNRKGRLKIATGKASVTVEAAKDCRVKIEAYDYRMAQPGDPIEVEGFYQEHGKGVGRSIKIVKSSKVADPPDQVAKGGKPNGDKANNPAKGGKPESKPEEPVQEQPAGEREPVILRIN